MVKAVYSPASLISSFRLSSEACASTSSFSRAIRMALHPSHPLGLGERAPRSASFFAPARLRLACLTSCAALSACLLTTSIASFDLALCSSAGVVPGVRLTVMRSSHSSASFWCICAFCSSCLIASLVAAADRARSTRSSWSFASAARSTQSSRCSTMWPAVLSNHCSRSSAVGSCLLKKSVSQGSISSSLLVSLSFARRFLLDGVCPGRAAFSVSSNDASACSSRSLRSFRPFASATSSITLASAALFSTRFAAAGSFSSSIGSSSIGA